MINEYYFTTFFKKKKFKLCMLFIIINILNFWIWEIFKAYFLIGVFLSLISISLFILTFIQLKSINKVILTLCIIFFCLTSIITVKNNFDPSFKSQNPTEVKMLNRWHGYFADGLGFLFTNKLSQNFYAHLFSPLSNYLRNISYSIDTNLYFFSSHPREKSGIDEFEKYSPLMLPFFIIGLLIHILALGNYKYLTFYLIGSILITGLISPYYKLGPLLLFPYINQVIILGVAGLFRLDSNRNEN